MSEASLDFDVFKECLEDTPGKSLYSIRIVRFVSNS